MQWWNVSRKDEDTSVRGFPPLRKVSVAYAQRSRRVGAKIWSGNFSFVVELTMDNQAKIPGSETIKRHVALLQDVCRQFDELNELLDRVKGVSLPKTGIE